MTTENQHLRVSRRLLDNRVDPPVFVDEEIPSVSVKFGTRRGRIMAPRGTVLDSWSISGSLRDFIPGSYGARITRLSVSSGSRNMSWVLRHSREGTLDVIDFHSPGQETRLGAPMEPLYAFGPGTLSWGWLGNNVGSMGSKHWTTQHLEGYVSVRRPDNL